MKTCKLGIQIKRVNTYFSLIIVSLIFSGMLGCSSLLSQETQITVDSQTPLPPMKGEGFNTPSLPPMPTFMITFYPNQSYCKEFYDDSLRSIGPMGRGIVLQLRGNKLGLKRENISPNIIAERSMLIINGNRIPNDTLLMGDGLVAGYGPYFLSWTPQLAPGLHEATFRFLNDFGETLEFTWQFILIDE